MIRGAGDSVRVVVAVFLIGVGFLLLRRVRPPR